jgi:Tfp pilus assembly protein PilO
VINPSPTSSPQPIGSQAPQKPISERPIEDSVQKAFDRAKDPNRPKPTPREAKMGDNNPPEETKREKFDLKKRPVDQPDRARAEHGHFAKSDATSTSVTKPDATRSQPGQPGQTAQPHPQLPETAPYRAPPQRFRNSAKAEWAAAPESVRGEVYRMHQEYDQAYRQYRADHEVMNSIRPFHQMAQQQGTNLNRVLGNYTTIEHKLRGDLLGGLDVIVDNLNLHAQDGRKITFRDVCWHVVNQTPEQINLMRANNAQIAQAHQLARQQQEIQALRAEQQRAQYVQHFNMTRSQVDQYAASHPRMDELANLIKQEIDFGFDLDTAYKRAERLSPVSQAAQTRGNGTTQAAQTRRPDRSIHGSPDVAPSNGASRRPMKQPSIDDALTNALRTVRGHL